MIEPLVSIIIPVYNGSNYMQQAIGSALAQTYKNIEVIVVNDGSNDGGATDAIARSYGKRIRYFSKENGGVSSALNEGIKNMFGEYFSWLSHDDVYEPDKIEKQVVAINQYGLDRKTLICCNCMDIDTFSKSLPKRKNVSGFAPYKIHQSKVVLTELLRHTTLNGCSLLIPKSILIDCGLFNEDLRFCQDALMWYKIFARDYSLFYINDISVKNRVHAGQLTQKGQKLFKKECEKISDILVDEFISISTPQTNFLRMYLFSDARYFTFRRIKEIIATGKEFDLISKKAAIKAYFICGYGHIRPFIRKIYYAIFRGITTG